MFFFRHPRPVVDGRTHAVQVVQQKATHEVSRAVLIVDVPVPDVRVADGPVPTPAPAPSRTDAP